MKNHIRALVVAAVCAAMAFGLNQISLFRFEAGGSITPASMLPVAMAGYLLGPFYGILSGLVMGLLDFITGAYIIHPIQLALDYFLAFGALGLAGFASKIENRNGAPIGMLIGYLIGITGRFVLVTLSGYIYFAEYTPDGWSPLAWSLFYNIRYIGVEAIFTVIIIFTLPFIKLLDTLKRELKKR